MPEIIGSIPAGASVGQIIHYGQLMQIDDFRKYDYGKTKNMIMYGTTTPPKYALENVDAPVVLRMTCLLTVQMLRDSAPNYQMLLECSKLKTQTSITLISFGLTMLVSCGTIK